MAKAALDEVATRFQQEVLRPLNSDLPLERQLSAVIAELQAFYEDGRLSCLLDTLSLGGTPETVAQQARATLEACQTALR